MKQGVFAPIVASLVFVATAAKADVQASIHFTRTASAASCPDESALQQSIRAQLGYDPANDRAALKVDALADRKQDKWIGTVRITRDGAEPAVREVTSRAATCTELASALAFTISMAIDPLFLSRPTHTELPPLPVSTPTPTLTPTPPRSPTPPPTPNLSHSAPVHFQLGAFPNVSIGTAPSAVFGLLATASFRVGNFSLGVEGRYDFPSVAALSTGGDVTTSLAGGSISPCVHVRVVALCALATFGALSAGSENVSGHHADTGLYVGVGGRVALEFAVSPFLRVGPQLDVLAAVSRPSLVFNDSLLWSMPPASGSLAVAITARL